MRSDFSIAKTSRVLSILHITLPMDRYSEYYLPAILFRLFDIIMYLYGYTYSKNMDQPGKVANPARGQQLNRVNGYFPARVRA